ncbi:hypothetical protein RFI_38986 [Reticulomyxa filosa]|uniref:Uncharacterized protein n=1 Tax=Reticulomyxa filosa TaxID=46433 RepID=X6LAX2_RETFI|nr:hypothetical protein RFI_38986 [Reticulomyxa filosa]|eukprot:ETN98505.1 hypothetical protein RFI_38986 [Reticulomyxa filosa]
MYVKHLLRESVETSFLLRPSVESDPEAKKDETLKARIHLVKFPKSIGYDTEKFDPAKFVPSTDPIKKNFICWRIFTDKSTEEQFVTSSQWPKKKKRKKNKLSMNKKKSLGLFVCLFKESNTRLLKWSDGSLSLMIGKEIFDIEESALDSGRDYLYAKLHNAEGMNLYKCHGDVISRFNVRSRTENMITAMKERMSQQAKRIALHSVKESKSAQRANVCPLLISFVMKRRDERQILTYTNYRDKKVNTIHYLQKKKSSYKDKVNGYQGLPEYPKRSWNKGLKIVNRTMK